MKRAHRPLTKVSKEESVANVKLIAARRPIRSPVAVDAAVVLNGYHELTEHMAMLERIRRSLRAGGNLVVLVDNAPQRATPDDPDDGETDYDIQALGSFFARPFAWSWNQVPGCISRIEAHFLLHA